MPEHKQYKYDVIKRFKLTDKTDLVLSWMIDPDTGSKRPFFNKQDNPEGGAKPFKSHGFSMPVEVAHLLAQELLKL